MARKPTMRELMDQLDTHTVPELKKICYQRGLPQSGSKNELIERLIRTPAATDDEFLAKMFSRGHRY